VKQQEYFRDNSLEEIKKILEQENPQHIFLVTGRQSYASCGAEPKIKEATKNYKSTHFYDFSPNPKLKDIERGIEKFKDSDLVIAVGGGSVLDTAKAINTLSQQEGNPEEYVTGKRKSEGKGKTMIAIPTTTGSGSEATHFCVVYYKGKKYSLASQNMTPKYVLLDPSLTMSMSPELAAASGADALCQAIESQWSVNSNPETQAYSKESIRLAQINLEKSVINPDMNSRAKMMKAANLAGKAINIAKTTAPHALSYFITSKYKISHGQAVLITLPEILEYNSQVNEEDCNDPRGPEHVREQIQVINQSFGSGNPQQTSRKFKELMLKIGLKTRLRELGVRQEDLPEIAESVNAERLKNNPRKILKKDLIKILQKAY
jgi:alcohol dehydrogenase class IV